MASDDFLAAHFSYGLNLDQAGLLRRAPDSLPLGSARLPDHRLAFDGVATICPALAVRPGATCGRSPRLDSTR